MYKINCPYCNEEIDIEQEDSEGWDTECPNCEREFEITVEYYPSFSVEEINYKKCEECGREVRDSELYSKENRNPFPKSLGDKIVCNDCYYRSAYKEMKNESGIALFEIKPNKI